MMAGQSPAPLRIGVLGAARIAALAIVGPAHTTGDRLVAVAVRDRHRAEAFAASHGVERVLDSYADVVPSGATGSARCNMAGDGVHMPCRIVGDRGEAVAANFALPTMDDRITVTTQDGRRVEHLGTRPTYTFQLEALRTHLRDGTPLPIDADDALATMELVDACYRAAGFPPRPRTPRVQPRR